MTIMNGKVFLATNQLINSLFVVVVVVVVVVIISFIVVTLIVINLSQPIYQSFFYNH